MIRWTYSLCLGFLLPCYAQADEATWQQNVELGFVKTGGNTQTQTLNTKAKVIHDDAVWHTQMQGSALKSSGQGTSTGEKYTASLQQDWKFSKRNYVFGRVSFESDRWANIRARYQESLGYGRIFSDDAVLKWTLDMGVGLRQTQWVASPKSQDTTVRIFTDAHWTVNDHVQLSQVLGTEGGKLGFVSRSETSLQQKMSSELSSKITFAVDHTSKVAVGIQKVNTELSVTLVWAH